MDGWMDGGWVDGCVGGWVDGWVGGWCISGRMEHSNCAA